MALEIFPSENDISGTVGGGLVPREVKLTQWNQGASSPYLQFRVDDPVNGDYSLVTPGSVLSGFEILTFTGLTQNFANGVAWIDGYRVEYDADSVVLTASSYNYIYLQLTKVSDLVTTAALVNVATNDFDDLGTPPSDSILLHCILTGAVEPTGQTWTYFTASTGMVAGRYFGDGNPTRGINLGFKPKLVYVQQQGTPRIMAFSDIGFPIETDISWGRAYLELESFGKMITKLIDHTSEPGLLPELRDFGFNVDGTGVQIANESARITANFNYDPPLLGTDASDTDTFTVTGAQIGDIATAHFEYAPNQAQFACRAWVTAADTVTVETTNITTSVNAPQDTMHISVLRQIPAATFSVNTNGEQYHYLAWS